MFSKQNSRSVIGWWFVLATLFILPALFTVQLRAQTDTAQIQGTVVDSTGAIISGVKITLTNIDTGAVSVVTSDGAGRFNFSALVRGHYRQYQLP